MVSLHKVGASYREGLQGLCRDLQVDRSAGLRDLQVCLVGTENSCRPVLFAQTSAKRHCRMGRHLP